MASTPEGKIKDKVKGILNVFRERHGLYYEMPVPGGYGKPTLDFIGWHYGRAFAIETKAPGKKPTPRQELTAMQMRKGGAEVFIIDGDAAQFRELHAWLASITAENANDSERADMG